MRAVTAACPSDAELAAHVGGIHDAAEAEAVGVHLDGCADCRATVVALVRARGTADGARAAPTLGPGATLGRYRLTRMIGAGAMGVVYAAHDPALDRAVAVKLMRAATAGDARALAERMVRESRLLARVSDPAVIAIHDVGEVDGQVYLAMELIEGTTLAGWSRARPRTVDEVVAVLVRAGAGLVAAHAAGVIHRDFKPENVLVAPSDAARPTRVAVTDFGVARAAAGAEARGAGGRGGDVELTATGVAIGTPAYMAPEQLDGGEVDARVDVFAFGVTLWEAIYGARPFVATTVRGLRAAIARGATPAGSSSRGRVPRSVRAALARMIAEDRDARPSTMAAALAALGPPSARPGRALVLGAAVLGAGVVAGAVLIARPSSVPPDACTAGARTAAAAWTPERAAVLRSQLLTDPTSASIIDRALATVRARASGLEAAYGERCRAAPTAPVLACLDARQVELAAVVDELTARPGLAPDAAEAFAFTIADAASCHAAGVSTFEPRWPRDPAQRRAVADVRIAAVAAEGLRDDARFDEARRAVDALATSVAAAGWAPLEAEHLYLRGGIEIIGGVAATGRELMQQAAATAERVHADYIAASAWAQLVQSATWDQRDPARGLEYARYADAASARLGRPAAVEAHLRYSRGTTRIAAADHAGGEADLRAALPLAERAAPELVPAIIQGLGLALEERGEYADAIDAYRRALAALVAAGGAGRPEEALFRARLAICLNHVGDTDAAIDEGRRATALADRILDERHPDRAIAHVHLAEVLHARGDDDAALIEIHLAQDLLRAATGPRSDLYGNALGTEAAIVTARDPQRAATLAEQACELQAFNVGDDAPTVAACWSDAAVALLAAGRVRDAERRLTTALPMLERALGPDHALVANTYISLGDARLQRGDEAAAARAFEEGRARMSRSTIDDGYLASAEYGLALAIAGREPTRARELMTQAAARWRGDPGWQAQLDDAEAWLRARTRR